MGYWETAQEALAEWKAIQKTHVFVEIVPADPPYPAGKQCIVCGYKTGEKTRPCTKESD